MGCGGKAGYYFSSTCVLVGSLALFLIDLHRHNLSRHKHTRANGTRHVCTSETCPQRRRLSFSHEPPDLDAGALAGALVLGPAELAALPGGGGLGTGGGIGATVGPDGIGNGAGSGLLLGADKPELTCISEEGIADMDLPDNLLDDLDYIGDCITSCNKVRDDFKMNSH